MTSLLVSWDPPKKRNGELVGYIVTYETAEQNERKYGQDHLQIFNGRFIIEYILVQTK